MNARKTVCLAALVAARVCCADYPVSVPEPEQVRLVRGFWHDRLETNRLATVKVDFDRYTEAGFLTNFQFAAARRTGVPYYGAPFEDADLFRIMEGAFNAARAAGRRDGQVDRAESFIPLIERAMEEDGYLYTARTTGQCHRRDVGSNRFERVQFSHEIYNVGQLVCAAVAHKKLTGRDDLVRLAVKASEVFLKTFGTETGRLCLVPGHEGPEMAYCDLYRLTGERKYLDLAKNFIDWRGRKDLRATWTDNVQDHLPVREQPEAIGHCVRACYLYAGMADVLALTGDESLRAPLDRLWDSAVNRKMFLSGGMGSKLWPEEAFAADYVLPNEKGYLETCAALANALLQERMFRLYADAKYVDVLERVLYNAIAGGVSFDGGAFFYENPLQSSGGKTRWRWHKCPCCPSNLVRILPLVGSWLYGTSAKDLWWNLFAESEATVALGNAKVTLRQETDYPFEGRMKLSVKPEEDGTRFVLHVRIPGWARGKPVPGDLYEQINAAQVSACRLSVNGEDVPVTVGSRGYVGLDRVWRRGDEVVLQLPLEPRFVRAHSRVAENVGCLAVERGPLVYCAESADNGPLEGRCIRMGSCRLEQRRIAGKVLPAVVTAGANPLMLIPYFAWSHRDKGEMRVWLRSAGRGF